MVMYLKGTLGFVDPNQPVHGWVEGACLFCSSSKLSIWVPVQLLRVQPPCQARRGSVLATWLPVHLVSLLTSVCTLQSNEKVPQPP